MPFQQQPQLGANGSNIQSGTERIRATEANRFDLTGAISASTYNYVGPVNTYVSPWSAVSVQTGLTGLYVVIGGVTTAPGGSVMWNAFFLGLVVDGGAVQAICLDTVGNVSTFGAVPVTGLATGIHTFQLSFAAVGTTYSGGATVLSDPVLVVRPL